MIREYLTAILFGTVVAAGLMCVLAILQTHGTLKPEDAQILFPGCVLIGILLAYSYVHSEPWKTPADREAEEQYEFDKDFN